MPAQLQQQHVTATACCVWQTLDEISTAGNFLFTTSKVNNQEYKCDNVYAFTKGKHAPERVQR